MLNITVFYKLKKDFSLLSLENQFSVDNTSNGILGWRWLSNEMSQFGYSTAKCCSLISHPVANVFHTLSISGMLYPGIQNFLLVTRTPPLTLVAKLATPALGSVGIGETKQPLAIWLLASASPGIKWLHQFR